MAPVEKGDLAFLKKNPSKLVEGIDAISNLPSKFSSKIVNDTTGDNAIYCWMTLIQTFHV